MPSGAVFATTALRKATGFGSVLEHVVQEHKIDVLFQLLEVMNPPRREARQPGESAGRERIVRLDEEVLEGETRMLCPQFARDVGVSRTDVEDPEPRRLLLERPFDVPDAHARLDAIVFPEFRCEFRLSPVAS